MYALRFIMQGILYIFTGVQVLFVRVAKYPSQYQEKLGPRISRGCYQGSPKICSKNKLDGHRPKVRQKYTPLCWVYFGRPRNIGRRNKRGCFQHPPCQHRSVNDSKLLNKIELRHPPSPILTIFSLTCPNQDLIKPYVEKSESYNN